MFGKYSVHSPSEEKVKSPKVKETIVNSKLYYLNKSQSKFVNVGLCVQKKFQPCIELGGKNKQSVVLSETEWQFILRNQGVLLSYVSTTDSYDAPIRCEDINIFFEKIDRIPIVKIEKNENYIYLGNESLCRLYEILNLVGYRLDILQKQSFSSYFNIFKNTNGNDCLKTIYKVISPNEHPNSENVCTMLELILQYPELLKEKLNEKTYYEECYF